MLKSPAKWKRWQLESTIDDRALGVDSINSFPSMRVQSFPAVSKRVCLAIERVTVEC